MITLKLSRENLTGKLPKDLPDVDGVEELRVARAHSSAARLRGRRTPACSRAPRPRSALAPAQRRSGRGRDVVATTADTSCDVGGSTVDSSTATVWFDRNLTSAYSAADRPDIRTSSEYVAAEPADSR